MGLPEKTSLIYKDPSYLLKISLIFLAYFLTAKIGLSLGAVHGFATPVWPPSGIALAAVLLFGRKIWPGIFLGAFFVNLISGASAGVSLGIGIGNTLEPLAGAYFLQKLGFRNSIKRLKDSTSLILIAAVFSTLISSVIGTLSLVLGGTITASEFKETWFAWWIGDILGDLVFAPLTLVWSYYPKLHHGLSRTLETTLIFLTLMLTSLVVFWGGWGIDTRTLPITYIVIPSLIWISVRFSQRASVTAIVLVSLIAIWGTVNGYGIFAQPDISRSLLLLEGFIGVHAATFLILSSVIAERRELERKKDDFIGIASHELKTPITTLNAYAQLLQKQPNQKKLLAYLPRIDEEINRLIRLVNDLLDFNRVRTDKMELNLKPFFINELVSSIVKDIQVAFKDRTIIYQKHLQVEVIADEYRIGQVLINLLSNAIKFSPPNKKIIIYTTKSKDYLRIDVKDYGKGISQKNQAEIFNKFFQAREKLKGAYSGLGLGLYISSEIIKQHKGRIWVKSIERKGSTFSFELPIAKN